MEASAEPEPTYRVAISSYQLDAKIPKGDPFWKPFNSSFRNESVTAVNLACAIYDGRPFTTWHKHNWRESDNYLSGQHLGLDFDTKDERSTLKHLIADPFISKYGSMVYTTASHTDEEPRARAVFLLDTPIAQPTNYALAARSLLWLYGTADRKCKDPARFFYGSKGCRMEFLQNVLPLDVVKQTIAAFTEANEQELRRRKRETYTAPVDQVDVDAALRMINPWHIDYDDWVAVLMGIHSAFGDAGLAMAESWADGEDGEVAHKWRSFKAKGNVSGAVTIATVFHMAKRFGWQRAA